MNLLELLTEDSPMFPMGSVSSEEQAIDWISDLKFFIDNDEALLNAHFFPAIKKHLNFVSHPRIHKVYISPIQKCINQYCEKFDLDDKDTTFPKDAIVTLAKQIAAEYEEQILNGEFGKYTEHNTD